MNQNYYSILIWVALFAMMYFVLIRPQQQAAKKKRQLIDSLEVKNQVITIGGIYGTILKVKENTVILKIADKVEIEILKNAVNDVIKG